MRRRLSGVGSFYRYCVSHDLLAADPTAGVARPRVDPDYTATVGLSREQGRALIAAADADGGGLGNVCGGCSRTCSRSGSPAWVGDLSDGLCNKILVH